MAVETFGTMPDGTPVERVTISGGGLTAKILSFGSVIQDLRLEGHAPALVLGYETFEPYLTKSPYFGATAGRYANRIRDAHLELDGKTYQLDVNFLGKHTLHGGSNGIGKRVWRFDDVHDDAVHMSIDLADGEMGFPGNMTIGLVYSLKEAGVLDIVMTAKTDATSVCNLAHHSYFNLDGSDTILDHMLQADADRFVELDDELIPTGAVLPVEGTSLDFRTAKSIRSAHDIKPIDNNLCIEEGAGTLRKVATLSSPISKVSMDVVTTEPGLQIYDAIKVDTDEPGLDGKVIHPAGGFCLEPQIWPDSCHHPDFPQAILRPGEEYHQQTQYVFRKD